MTHTPGPWTHYDDSNDSTRRHEIAAHGKTVARVYCTKGHEDADRGNARLIAAAPEMLEALESVLPYMEEAESAGLVGHEGCHWPVEAVRDAIRNAKGG